MDNPNKGKLIIHTVSKAITDEFVDSFKDDADYTGAVARMVAMEILPDGVSPYDYRVVAIVERCKEAVKESDGT